VCRVKNPIFLRAAQEFSSCRYDIVVQSRKFDDELGLSPKEMYYYVIYT